MKTNIKLFFTLLFLFIYVITNAQKFEAEDAQLSGNALKTANTEASGGYVVNQKDGSLTFDITISETAYYNVYVFASAPGGKKTNTFSINGGDINFTFQQNDTIKGVKVISNLKLSSGSIQVKILKSWGYINIDYILFETTDPNNRFLINNELVTPNADDHTKKLYQFLYDNYGKKIISGVHAGKNLEEINWLKQQTGKEPALAGFDFLFCGRGYNWYNDDTPVNEARYFYNKNGIPAFCWHWRDPSRKTEAFYTKDTDFDVSKVTDTTSAEYTAIIKDIDYISGLIEKLQNYGVPILWRPLHEAAGGWFWWGAKGAEPCKALYRLMYNRMVKHNKLTNLIWVWTSQQNDLDWYPGDEYVDIVGRDIYKEGDHSSQILEFNKLNDDYGGKKMITLSECGSFPDPDKLLDDEVPWSFFMPWNGDFVRKANYNSLELWKKTLEHSYVITLDEMPDLKNYTTPAEPNWRSSLYPENWQPGYMDTQGRFLHDFSYAGYHQGEKKIPVVNKQIVDVTQPPYDADNTGQTDVSTVIQQALDDVGKNGGGVVFLPPGTYRVNPGNNETALRIKYSNTVLRGAGPDSTFIFNSTSNMRQKNIIWVMHDWSNWANEIGSVSKISTDLLFPTQIIPVESVSGFKPGDDIILRTDGTDDFIAEHNMQGIWENWAARVMFHRTIDSIDIEKKLIFIDSPTRYYMKLRDNARVYHAKAHISECGIENLSIGNQESNKTGWGEESYQTPGTGAYEVHASHAMYFKYAKNCWVKKVQTYKPASNSNDIHVVSNCLVLNMCRGITVDSCFFQKPQYEGGGGNGYMYTLQSNDCLIQNSRANDARHNFDFKMPYSNGNVIYNCTGENSKYSSDFHMYLSMSNLIDNFTVDGDYLESTFRPYGGSVIHGYSSTQSVFYNTTGKSYHSNKNYIIESRQFGHGYIIGTSGEANAVKLDPTQGTAGGYSFNTSPRDFSEGIGKGDLLTPKSLYIDQLNRRMQNSTGLKKYRLTLDFIHKFTGDAVADCSVSLFGNSEQQTNPNGQASFENVNNLVILNASKTGFYAISNKQFTIFSDTTINIALTPQEYKVAIMAHDKNTGQFFTGTPITFNGQLQVTDNEGKAFFDAYAGTFQFLIDKNAYLPLNGIVNVNSDTTFHFYLTRSSATLKIKLKENGLPVNKASVILETDTLISTGLGIAKFNELEINRYYNYFISKGGYNDISGSVFLTNDTTLLIEMDAYKTITSELKNKQIIHVWPNPFSSSLHFQTNTFDTGRIEISDVNGMIIRKLNFENKSIRIDTKFFAKGIYFFRYFSNNKQIRLKLIKN